MTFDLDKAHAEAEALYPPFEITVQGVAYQMPHGRMLDPSVVATLEGRTSFDAMDKAMADLAPELWPKVKARGMGVVEDFFDKWSRHSGFVDDNGDDSGKGRPQSSAPNRAARRSKPTSRSGASTSTRSGSGKSKGASGSS